MDSMFIDILQKLITEQGKKTLLNHAKCKAFLAVGAAVSVTLL